MVMAYMDIGDSPQFVRHLGIKKRLIDKGVKHE
jgi:hypothetical protein